MKKIIIFLFASFLYPSIQSQVVTQKQIFDYRSISNIDSSVHTYNIWLSFGYERTTGTYVCKKADSTNGIKDKIFSNKGNSRAYDLRDDMVFDSLGNYYEVVIDSVSKNKVVYYLLKNGSEFLKSDETIFLTENKGNIYFILSKDNKRTIYCYNPINDNIIAWKPYYMCSQLMFTKNNKPFFFAMTGSDHSTGNVFLVFDGVEQKHYSDIYYFYHNDKDGYPVFAAKDKGKFYPLYDEDNISTGQFVVYKNNEYKKFESVQLTNYFTDSGLPVYCAKDFDVEAGKVMFGNKSASKLYSNINNIIITKDRKLVFTAGSYNNPIIVYDGIESNNLGTIDDIKVYPDGLLCIAGDYREKFVVFNLNIIKTGMFNIIDFHIMPNGELEFSGLISKYDSLTKKYTVETNIRVGEKEFGPLSIAWICTREAIIADSIGNYCFIVSVQSPYTTEDRVELQSNLDKSIDFSVIFNVHFYKGKILFEGINSVNRIYYSNTHQLYYDFKPVSDEFDYIQNFKFDESTGIITFVGLKNYVFYDVEIKL